MADSDSQRRASREQKAYARSLGLEFDSDIGAEALATCIALRRRELFPPPDWLSKVASHLGVGNEFSTDRDLFNLIESDLLLDGRELELVVWFLYGVSRHLCREAWDAPEDSGLPADEMEKLAHRLLGEPWILSSLKDYQPGTLYRFGALFGRTDTLAYKAVAKLLEEELGLAAERFDEPQSSPPRRACL